MLETGVLPVLRALAADRDAERAVLPVDAWSFAFEDFVATKAPLDTFSSAGSAASGDASGDDEGPEWSQIDADPVVF